MDAKKRSRVAIVGTGMAGLVTAYLLNQDRRGRYEVTVFESCSEPSLDSASFSIRDPLNQRELARVDLPMRSFSGGFYGALRALYDHLDVPYRPQRFSFRFAKLRHDQGNEMRRTDPSPYFIHTSNHHQMPPKRPDGCSLIVWLLETIHVTVCYAWFTLCCFMLPPRSGFRDIPCESLREYLFRVRIPQYFVSNFLLPLICSVTTCTHKQLLDFPAQDILDYKRMTHGAEHYVVDGGIRNVQRKLLKGLNVQFNSTVTHVQPDGGMVRLAYQEGSSITAERPSKCDKHELFDQAVLAVSPDVVARICASLRQTVSSIPTTTVESVVHVNSNSAAPHIDLSQLAHGKQGSSQIITLNTSHAENATESIHELLPSILISTWPISPIDPAKVLHRAKFTRVLRTPKSRRIVNRIFRDEDKSCKADPQAEGRIEIEKEAKETWRNGDQGVWLVGGWCWDGLVLLEGCVVSAVRAAEGLGVDVPWKDNAGDDDFNHDENFAILSKSK